MRNDPIYDDYDDVEPEHGAFKRSRWLLVVPVLILLLLLWPGWTGFYSEWLWFEELG